MTEHNLYSPNFRDFLYHYDYSKENVKEKILNHPNNDDPQRLINAIIDTKAIELGIKEKDFIIAIYQYQYVQIGSENVKYHEWDNFRKSYEKRTDLPDIKIFRKAIRDDSILDSLEKIFNKTLIIEMYRKLSETN